MGEEPRADGQHDEDDGDVDDESKLAGSAEESAGELVVSCSVGDGHLWFEGAVDHLNHLQGDAGDRAGDTEDDDSDRAKGISDGEETAVETESIAHGEAHEGDGRASESANLADTGVMPSVFKPWDVTTDEETHDDGGDDVSDGVDECCCSCAAAENNGDKDGNEGEKREEGSKESAIGVAADATIGGLDELLELAEEDGDTEVEDDPLGVCL